MAETLDCTAFQGVLFDPKRDDDDAAGRYDQIATPQYETGLLLAGAGRICMGESILDICCGPGRLSAALAMLVGARGRVIGVDWDDKRIQQAKRLENEYSNLSFQGAKAQALPPFPDVRFHVAFMNAGVHYIPKEETLAAFLEARRILLPGGRLMLSTASKRDGSVFYDIRERVLSQDCFKPYYTPGQKDAITYYDEADLRGFYAKAGFRNIDVYPVNSVVETKTAQEMLDIPETSSCKHFLQHLGLPGTLLERAQREVMEALENYRDGEKIRITRVNLLGIGYKSLSDVTE